MERFYTVFLILSFSVSLTSCGKQADPADLPDSVSPPVATDVSPAETTQPEEDGGMDPVPGDAKVPTKAVLPTPAVLPAPTQTQPCTTPPTPSPQPSASPAPPEPTLPPLDITLVDEKLPWDDQALPETDYVYIVRFILTDRDDLLVAYDVCVDIKWDENGFYDDKRRPKRLHTWWLREDAMCFVSSTWEGACLLPHVDPPRHITQDLSRWETVEATEPGMYSISHDLFRWMIKWHGMNWWCGVKDGEIVYVREHMEG